MQLVHEPARVGETQLGRIRDARSMDEDGQDLRLEPFAVAHRAGHLAQVFRPASALRVGVGLDVLPFDVRNDPLEARGVAHLPAVAVLPPDFDFEVVPAHDRIADLFAQVAPRGLEREPEVACETVEQLLVVVEEPLALRGPRDDDALGDAQVVVGEQQGLVDGHARSQAGAFGARAEGRVEREGPRFDLGELDGVAVGAGQLLAERPPRLWPREVDEVDLDEPVGEPERRLERVGQPAEDVGTGHESVDDDGDVVLVLLLQRGRIAQLDLFAVDERARVAAGRELFEQVDELALLLRDDRAEDLVAGAGFELHELVGDLLHGLPLDRLTADRAMRDADARPQQPHVVVDLGDGSDRRPRVAVGGLLVDGDGRAEALDEVDVGPIDLPEELPGVSRQRLDVASLSFGEDRVEREGRFARAGQPREDDE